MESGSDVNEDSGFGVGGDETTTCELESGIWILRDGVAVGERFCVFKSSTGRLMTGGPLARAGNVRVPIGSETAVGAVGRPGRTASAIVLPLPSSTIRSTSVVTTTTCRRRCL